MTHKSLIEKAAAPFMEQTFPKDKRRGRAPRVITDPMHCPSCKQAVALEWFRRTGRGVPYTWCMFCEAIDQPTLERRVQAAGEVG